MPSILAHLQVGFLSYVLVIYIIYTIPRQSTSYELPNPQLMKTLLYIIFILVFPLF